MKVHNYLVAAYSLFSRSTAAPIRNTSPQKARAQRKRSILFIQISYAKRRTEIADGNGSAICACS